TSYTTVGGETVSASTIGLKNLGICGQAQLLAQVGYVCFDDIGVVLPGEVVQVFEKLTLGDDHTGPMDAVLGGRQVDEVSAAGNRLLGEVQTDHTELEDRLRNAFAAADQGAHSCDQLAEIERLRHVVVRAEVEQLDGGLRVAESGEHQHWRPVVR